MSTGNTDTSKKEPQLWYHGVRRALGGTVVAVVNDLGHQIRLLRHHVKHSPDGFEWGYSGSGPAELARCILLDAVDDPRCPSCAGTHKVMTLTEGDRPFDPRTDDADSELVGACLDCDTDGLAALPYQRFKREFVARWQSNEWRISRDDVRTWLASQHAPAAAQT